MERRSRPDLFAGLFFILVGVGFLAASQSYGLGSPARMGPGYFPSAVAGVLVLLGVAIVVQGLSTREEASEGSAVAFSWTAAILILGSVVLFALALAYAGAVVAIVVTVMAASAAVGRAFHWQTILLGMGLAVFSVLLFVVLLGLPLPLWPAF